MTSAENKALRELREYIEDEHSSATFACGGSIVVDCPAARERNIPFTRHASVPVTIGWWDKDSESFSGKLVLPLDDSKGSNAEAVQKVVDACSPVGAESDDDGLMDIDTNHRGVWGLSWKNFVTSFHPADFDILHNIEQVMLPGFNTDIQNRLQFRRITAVPSRLTVCLLLTYTAHLHARTETNNRT